MTYAKKLTSLGELALAPHKEKIVSLSPGEDYLLKGSRSDLDSLRYYLYVFFEINSLKQLYKVYRASPTQLVVSKVLIPTAQGFVKQNLSSIENFVLEELAEVEDQPTAEEKIDSGIADGRVNAEDSGNILLEWRRINRKR